MQSLQEGLNSISQTVQNNLEKQNKEKQNARVELNKYIADASKNEQRPSDFNDRQCYDFILKVLGTIHDKKENPTEAIQVLANEFVNLTGKNLRQDISKSRLLTGLAAAAGNSEALDAMSAIRNTSR